MLLMATVDDVPAEAIPYLIERAMEAGADNVHVVSAITKKNRMEHIVFVDLREEKLEDMYVLMAMEFGTIGAKAIAHEHITLPYRLEHRSVRVSAQDGGLEGDVRVKYVEKDGRILSLKAEYEDLRALARRLAAAGHPIPLSKLKALVEADAYEKALVEDGIYVTVKA